MRDVEADQTEQRHEQQEAEALAEADQYHDGDRHAYAPRRGGDELRKEGKNRRLVDVETVPFIPTLTPAGSRSF